MARPPVIETSPATRLVLNVRSLRLTDDQFIRLCGDNRDFRIEMTADGELIILPPPGLKTSKRNFIIIQRLANWAEQDGSGVGFATDAGLTLPNGAKRGLDAAWMLLQRWDAISGE